MRACTVPTVSPPVRSGVGAFPISTRRPDAPGRDWFDSDECAAILAQRFEPETSNPFAHDREPDPEIDG